MSTTHRGLSDSQANAEALSRRETTYTLASEASVKAAWDFHHREPRGLTEAVNMIRTAYSDEVPMRLHEGYDSIGEGGTPKMDARAEGYIFGHDFAGEAPRPKCDCVPDVADTFLGRPLAKPISQHQPECATVQTPALDYYRTPFRAALASFTRSSPRRGAVISHIAIGSMGPIPATIMEGVPNWCARVVAEDTCRAFLRILSDVKIDRPRADAA